MKNLQLNIDLKRNEYLFFILKSLNIPIDEFSQSITNPDSCYERVIYKWSIKLFERGASKERATKIIFKARILYFIRNVSVPDDQEKQQKYPSGNLTELLRLLQSNEQYQKMDNKEQLIIQQKIDGLIGTASIGEIINEVLNNETIENSISQKTTLVQRLINQIKKLKTF